MHYEEIIMQLIVHGGNARSASIKAIQSARAKDLSEAAKLLAEADESLNIAHETQTKLIQAEVGGTPTTVTLLMVHAQDHLMNAMTVRDLAREIVELCAA